MAESSRENTLKNAYEAAVDTCFDLESLIDWTSEEAWQGGRHASLAHQVSDQLSVVAAGRTHLRELLSRDTLESFDAANEYPACWKHYCERSFVLIVRELVSDTIEWMVHVVEPERRERYRNLIAPTPIAFKEAREQFFNQPFSPEVLLENRSTIADFSKQAPAPDRLLYINLHKELRRVGYTVEDPEPGKNEERDAWIYDQIEAGVTRSAVCERLQELHPEWEQLATPQGVTSAMRRYCSRTEKPRLSRGAGRPRK